MRGILRPGMLLAALLPALLTTSRGWDVDSQETASPPTWVVTGQVLDAVSGEPLPGAVVRHRESTVSDQEGRFRFEIPAEDQPVIWIYARADGHQRRGLKWNAKHVPGTWRDPQPRGPKRVPAICRAPVLRRRTDCGRRGPSMATYAG